MKKSLLLLLTGLSFHAVQSQELSIPDALRYAQDNLNGTARFRAMGGAFGALGGDLSALNVNPAGSAIFTTNQMAFTLSSYNTKNESNFFGTKTSENDNAFDINQAGAVFIFENDDPESNWKKISLAVNYDNMRSFENTIHSVGTNPTSSIGNYFTHFANMNGGIPESLLQTTNITNQYIYLGENYGLAHQQAFLGYQGFIIDPTSSLYEANMSGGNYVQSNYVESTGYNGKLAFNIATQYKDKFYFGLNLNSHFTDFTQTSHFFERNSNHPTSGVQRVYFDNELYTYGSGFSFQLGAIAKVTNALRVGLAYESPTWYRLNDELTQRLAAVSADTDGDLPTDIVNPYVTNVYETYKLQTPGKWTGSFAYVFGKKALISVDYAIKDYSNTKFRPKDDYRDLNSGMSDLLDITSELRVGGEYRIKDFSLRGGYRMEQSPYKNGKTVGDLTSYSTGIGYNFGSVKVDLSYTYSQRSAFQQFFSSGLTDYGVVNTINNNVSATVIFEL